MNLIKKLVAWFEDLLWKSAIKDLLENPESNLGVEDKDGADDPSRCCYSGVKCYADDCGTCKERTNYFKEES